MQEIISAFILALVQGITEWLPISSSGHLVLFENLLDYRGGLVFEIALHLGTLMAVFVYFGREITDILQDLLKLKFRSENGKLGLLIAFSSIPAGIVGFFVKDYFDSLFSGLTLVALGFAITGLILIIASRSKDTGRKIGYREALLIGLAQAVAILPGISRSGSTISSALIMGVEERKAMRFSFLMSIPVIFGASLLTLRDVKVLPPEMIWATLLCFFVALGVLHLMYKYFLINRKNFLWFGIYCLVLAIVLLVYLIA